MKLLLMNYSMNSSSQIFSHQRKVVSELSKKIDEIDVITSDVFRDLPIENVNVFSVRWQLGKTFRNISNFYKVAIPLLLKHRGGIVFSHMTDVQSALIALPCRILGIRHILWYAHKTPSIFLKFCYPFLSVLATSTPGSCPISGKKVVILGQAIDCSMSHGPYRPPGIPPKSFYHVGRIDPSKNIELVIRAVEALYRDDQEVRLNIYGAPSTDKYENYFQSLKSTYAKSEWITFHGPITSKELAKISNRHDGFVHAFWGSLDKALIEAIVLRRIVISGNPEYLDQFEKKKILETDLEQEILGQIKTLRHSTRHAIQADVERKLAIALDSHELKGWINRLVKVLNDLDALS